MFGKIALVLMTVGVFTAGDAFAQKDKLSTGEQLTGTVIKGKGATVPAISHEKAPSVPVEATTAVEGLKINVDKASPHVRDSINFLLHWCGRRQHPEVLGPNVTVNSVPMQDTKLTCPASGLVTIRDKGVVVGMRLKTADVSIKGVKTNSPSGWRLDLKPRTDGYMITGVRTF